MGKMDELIRKNDSLIEKFTTFTAELKARNEIDRQIMTDNTRREREAMWERRTLIVMILVLAGANVAQLAGVA